jgi:galactokinase
VVMSSTVVAPKSGSARESYNTRRAESERAILDVGEELGISQDGSTYPALLRHPGAAELLAVGARVLAADLLRRFRHAVSEADRVRRAEEALRAADMAEFGRLMSASHASLRDDYDVSCPELDQVTAIAEAAGAAGARLTGAGFGGSAVALCEGDDGAAAVVRALDRKFYATHAAGSNLNDLRFVAEAGGGAGVEAVSLHSTGVCTGCRTEPRGR